MGAFTGEFRPGAEGTARYVAALMGVLQAQRTTLTGLLDVADRQQAAIMERDREAIEATTREQDALFAELQGLEYDREQIQQSLGRHMVGGPAEADAGAAADAGAGAGAERGAGAAEGAAAEVAAGAETGTGAKVGTGFQSSGDAGVDFDRLLRALPPGDRVMLTAARDEARRLLASLSSVNRANQQLLAQELALFDMYMSVLNPDMSAEAYSDPGQGRKGSHSAAVAFDTRA